ncbi:MAG: formylglycine-generating enzyme family protein [bacterium]|nr:formylglycine-generating enzyme family protein [bacterium]
MKTTNKTAKCLSHAAAFAVLVMLSAFTAVAGRVTVTNVTAAQRIGTPIVDIVYELLNPSGGVHTVLLYASTNAGATYSLPCTNFSGDVGAGVTAGANKQVVWFAAGDLAAMSTALARVQVTAMEGTNDYCIIDVAGGPNASNYPVSYQATAPPLDDTHKTSKIVLRKIPAGSFVMGSPAGELGRWSDETQHNVTLTKDFYMGIYEITQAQYSNVMGSNPAYFKQGAHAPIRPVEKVSWNTVRGGTWPTGTLSSTSFMGTLRAKAAALAFDLPTEAQWEYACRASTPKALNNNTNLQNIEQDPNMDILGRYWYNGGSSYSSDPVNGAHTTVGSYVVNQWGLYDMHGNVWEWCLDWHGAYGGDAIDPSGLEAGSLRVMRGGSWSHYAWACRSAYRDGGNSGYAVSSLGFRLSLPAGQ